MKRHARGIRGAAMSAVVAAILGAPPPAASAQALSCPVLEELLSRSQTADWRHAEGLLAAGEDAVRSRVVHGERAPCLVRLADLRRDRGDYDAERLYLAAAQDAPEDAAVLEAAARYYRNYRGAKGLFALSEELYLRAEQALARHPNQRSESETELLSEKIARGRIELQKREGLGMVTPSEPGEAFGLYLGTQLDAGNLPFAHNDLATPARTLLNADPAFDVRLLLRDRDQQRWRSRLRLRGGRLPYVDAAWTRIDEGNTLASQTTPVAFSDVDIEELEVGLENAHSLLPLGDLLWRVDYRRGTFDVAGPAWEKYRRLTGAVTWTTNLGAIKTDLQLIGSKAAVDTPGAVDADDDGLVAANARFLYFPQAAAKRPIDPRGHEYGFGYVSRKRDFGPQVTLRQDTYFVDAKLRDLVSGRVDIEALVNHFRNDVDGRTREDSSDTESNVITTVRLVDRVNRLWPLQTRRAIGIAQWALVLRLLDDRSGGDLPDFASRGYAIGSFVELFSRQLSHTTLIFEGAHESRDYHRLGVRDERSRLALRLGF